MMKTKRNNFLSYFVPIIFMGLLFGIRPKNTSVNNTTDIENYGLSFVGSGQQDLEIYSDIQIPLQEIRRDIIKNQDPINIQFILENC